MNKLKLLLFSLIFGSSASAQLQADFHCAGCTFDLCGSNFVDISVQGTSPIVNWFWDFGNGTTNNLQYPSCVVCYDSIGSYSVCLTILDFNGNSKILSRYGVSPIS